jgi:dTDP-glucose pyrophosphorylase
MEMSELPAKFPTMEKAVVLARGLGMRMRRADKPIAGLSAEQAKTAATGVKAMMPIGRPFLDYTLSALADAGFQKICLVIGPEHGNIREYYSSVLPKRLTIEFAIQENPLGTADAVHAAEGFAADDLFLVINADNYYPAEVLQQMRELDGPGLAAFNRDALLALSNMEAERIRQFAIVEIKDGHLAGIMEKPTEVPSSGDIYVSMNCWAFNAAIFAACKRVKKSVRGELELTDAVQIAMNALGERFRVIPVSTGVLDLSSPHDISSVEIMLRGTKVDL